MSGPRRVLAAAVLLAGALTTTAGADGAAGAAKATAAPFARPVPRYDHVFVIVEENHGYGDVIDNPAAPNLNWLARHYGLATSYYGVSHPSEPNYVALLGGSTFGVSNDNPYYLNSVRAPSLITQLDRGHVSWKAYLQGVPHPGYQGICFPAFCNGTPDKDPLYVSKHDGIQNFTTSRNPADWRRQVPLGDLTADLRGGRVPAFGYVIPDECHDQHGDPPYCLDSGSLRGPQDQHLVATGDAHLGRLVHAITSAPFWARGNNAVVITYDEGDTNAGCCRANRGGGKVATVVVTSHGPRGVRDATPYNHYSLLQTLQRTFGLGCLQATCDTAAVRPMTRLFTPLGVPATATRALDVPFFRTPTPVPAEPVSYVTRTPSRAGWTVQRVPRLGMADNSFGAVAAASPGDVWAVGNYLPDATGSNPDATLALAAHFNGGRWISTPVPDAGPNFNTLFGVAARPGRAWAVGVALNAGFAAHSLVEAWNGRRWHIVPTPNLRTRRDMLFAASADSDKDVWAVGQQEDLSGRFHTLVEHWDGARWAVIPAADPGSAGNQFYAVTAVGPRDVWAVGQRNDQTGDTPLVEHWNGSAWSVTAAPAPRHAAAYLDAVVADGRGGLWAVGQTDDAANGSRALVAHYAGGAWRTSLLSVGSDFTNLNGVAVADRRPWAVGTYYDPASDRQRTLVVHLTGSTWQAVPAPSPGTGDAVLGGLVAAGQQLWTGGYYKDATGREPLIEHASP